MLSRLSTKWEITVDPDQLEKVLACFELFDDEFVDLLRGKAENDTDVANLVKAYDSLKSQLHEFAEDNVDFDMRDQTGDDE